MKTLEDIYGPYITEELVTSLLTASELGKPASVKAATHFVYLDTLDVRARNAAKASEFWDKLGTMCKDWLNRRVITLTLQGPPNQMIMLFNRTEFIENTTLYIVNNASCYAKAIEEIAIKEDMTQRQVDDIVYIQNGKTYKKMFLKSKDYKVLTSYDMVKLNELILQHFNVEAQ